jgi:hypothetical protein
MHVCSHHLALCRYSYVLCKSGSVFLTGTFLFSMTPIKQERRGEATLLPAELDRDVPGEPVHRGVGAGGRLRHRRMGQHGQLRQADRHVRALRQVLPVPQADRRPGRGRGALAAPLDSPTRQGLSKEVLPSGRCSIVDRLQPECVLLFA